MGGGMWINGVDRSIDSLASRRPSMCETHGPTRRGATSSNGSVKNGSRGPRGGRRLEQRARNQQAKAAWAPTDPQGVCGAYAGGEQASPNHAPEQPSTATKWAQSIMGTGSRAPFPSSSLGTTALSMRRACPIGPESSQVSRTPRRFSDLLKSGPESIDP